MFKARYNEDNDNWYIDRLDQDGNVEVENLITLGSVSGRTAGLIAYELNRAYDLGSDSKR